MNSDPQGAAAAAASNQIASLAALADREHRADRLSEAAEAYRQILRIDPRLAEAHNNLGNVLNDQGQLDDALVHYQTAATLKPTLLPAHNNLGNILKRQRKLTQAVAAFERALALDNNLAEVHNNLGAVLRELGKDDEGTAHLETALALNPNYAQAHANLGGALKHQGRFDEARAHFERALEIDPSLAEAHWQRATLKMFQPGDPDLATLEALAAGHRLPPAQMVCVHFALGKALDDVGQYDRAFQQWILGHGLKRREAGDHLPSNPELFGPIIDTFDAQLFQRLAGAGDPSPLPIFILGMPRSGSTLVEQILASHPLVHGGGELLNLGRIAHQAFDPAGRTLAYPSYVPRLDASSIGRLGRTYLESLPPLPAGKTRLTDKMPANFPYVGLIHLALPQARIIHTVRDPVDTCVSCFSNVLAFGYEFGYDLAQLGRYYRAYRRLMDHWRAVLPAGSMLDVVYEEVVDDLEGQARRVIEYLGLPWDDRCLDFHQTRRQVGTASNVQVRRPVYRSAVARWRRYAAHLGPLLAELGDELRPE